MNDSTQILKSEFESIQQDLIRRHEELGMKASGDWIDSLEVSAKGMRATIFGLDYTNYLVNGREPGRFPPIKKIEQWIYDKNISIEGKISISSLAFLIARKIAKEGTEYFKKGGTDLVESVITPERIQRIIDRVTEFHVSSFTSEINGLLKKMAA
ncbi:hypothetical protein [Aquimarina intermedia]|uniref:Uncharacterized protein n=1 Tax=Aquimarina intermedia TaxID=350814 RepID=A0A5S5C0K0_9FLAO|nr:hypothetical protein [Aquimarina intermedia]TYP71493.1 hypothetical protein BD809_10975 [Aquimarina intermedia]